MPKLSKPSSEYIHCSLHSQSVSLPLVKPETIFCHYNFTKSTSSVTDLDSKNARIDLGFSELSAPDVAAPYRKS